MILPHPGLPLPTGTSCVLFDMDGTLFDSAPGVTASAAHALSAVGVQVPAADVLRRFVGPPMIESFRTLAGVDEETAQSALLVYRRTYAASDARQSRPYDGVLALLKQLQSVGLPMAVATSKVEDQALRLVRHHGMENFFADICGASDLHGRANKSDVIAESLVRLRSGGVDTARPVMVGDRKYDVEGAAAHAIPTIFALWGYGTAGEASRAAAAADHPAEVFGMVMGNRIAL